MRSRRSRHGRTSTRRGSKGATGAAAARAPPGRAATSRALRVAGETTYQVPSLAFPGKDATQLTPSEVRAFESVEFFVERAPAAGDAFSLNDENAHAVAEICRRLDGIPLALELAAARLKVLGPRQLRDRLDERFRLLTGGGRDVLPRHQTLRALIDWSYDLLDQRERELFRRLGTFVDGFALEGAIAVGSREFLEEFDLFDVLASLVDKSLVIAESHTDAVRYRLLETTRAYALEKLDAVGEHDLDAGRHLRYLRDRFAEQGEESERTARSTDFVATFQAELDDVRTALERALERSDLLAGAELLANIDRVWRDLGLETEGIARCEAFLAVLPEHEAQLRVWLSSVLSWLLSDMYRKVRAFGVASEAVRQVRASGDAVSLARAPAYYALTATFLHRFEDAETASTQAEAIPEASASVRIVLLETRAHLNRLRGDFDTAAETFEQLRNEHRSIGNPDSIPAAGLAEVEHARGRTERAIAIVREALPAACSRPDKRTLATLLVNLAGYLVATNDLLGAIVAAREAIEIRAAHEPDRVGVAVAIEHVALIAALRGHFARAAALEGFVDAAFERNGAVREFTETTTHDCLWALLTGTVAPEELARLRADGAALAPENAIALALADDEDAPPAETHAPI